MLAIVSLLLGVSSAWNKEYDLKEIHAMDRRAAFKAWSVEFGRNYASVTEESEKFLTWLDNLYLIASYNSRNLTFKLRMNQFGDMTKDEFLTYTNGEDGQCFKDRDAIVNSFGRDRKQPLKMLRDELTRPQVNPDSIDWTDKDGKNYVTPVKNQGQCGSCWAFSTTGALECRYAIANDGEINSLSEQQLVDCAGIRYGCEGCNGGQMTGGLKYAANNGGLCSEEEYRYEAKDGTCKESSCGTKYDASTGYDAVTPDDSQALEDAVAQGCVSIGIEADQSAFQFYSSGVLSGTCGTRIDHGVLVVGYGTEGNQKYWKVKNSWGDSWGEEGYVLICRDCDKNGREGECGILDQPNVPTF